MCVYQGLMWPCPHNSYPRCVRVVGVVGFVSIYPTHVISLSTRLHSVVPVAPASRGNRFEIYTVLALSNPYQKNKLTEWPFFCYISPLSRQQLEEIHWNLGNARFPYLKKAGSAQRTRFSVSVTNSFSSFVIQSGLNEVKIASCKTGE